MQARRLSRPKDRRGDGAHLLAQGHVEGGRLLRDELAHAERDGVEAVHVHRVEVRACVLKQRVQALGGVRVEERRAALAVALRSEAPAVEREQRLRERGEIVVGEGAVHVAGGQQELEGREEAGEVCVGAPRGRLAADPVQGRADAAREARGARVGGVGVHALWPLCHHLTHALGPVHDARQLQDDGALSGGVALRGAAEGACQ